MLACALLQFYGRIREQSARIPAARKSTQDELFRRLLIGREYIHSHIATPLSLADVARAACVSPFHFHRGFTQAFQQTPHAYITGLRLDKARQLLGSGLGVLEVAIEVGFSSPSTFSRLFRSRFGMAPSSARPRKFARLER